MRVIEFVGRPDDGGITTSVRFRGETVGTVYLTLEQWDQLHRDAQSDHMAWVNVLATSLDERQARA